jgi:hypothetical protein
VVSCGFDRAQLQASYGITNIFDEQYQEVFGFPSPIALFLRAFTGALVATLGNPSGNINPNEKTILGILLGRSSLYLFFFSRRRSFTDQQSMASVEPSRINNE